MQSQTSPIYGISLKPAEPITLEEIGNCTLEEIERKVILQRLAFFAGNKRRTAGTLGCSVKTLYNKLDEYRRLDAQKSRSAS